jgi:hypothetical protein
VTAVEPEDDEETRERRAERLISIRSAGGDARDDAHTANRKRARAPGDEGGGGGAQQSARGDEGGGGDDVVGDLRQKLTGRGGRGRGGGGGAGTGAGTGAGKDSSGAGAPDLRQMIASKRSSH